MPRKRSAAPILYSRSSTCARFDETIFVLRVSILTSLTSEKSSNDSLSVSAVQLLRFLGSAARLEASER